MKSPFKFFVTHIENLLEKDETEQAISSLKQVVWAENHRSKIIAISSRWSAYKKNIINFLLEPGTKESDRAISLIVNSINELLLLLRPEDCDSEAISYLNTMELKGEKQRMAFKDWDVEEEKLNLKYLLFSNRPNAVSYIEKDNKFLQFFKHSEIQIDHYGTVTFSTLWELRSNQDGTPWAIGNWLEETEYKAVFDLSDIIEVSIDNTIYSNPEREDLFSLKIIAFSKKCIKQKYNIKKSKFGVVINNKKEKKVEKIGLVLKNRSQVEQQVKNSIEQIIAFYKTKKSDYNPSYHIYNFCILYNQTLSCEENTLMKIQDIHAGQRLQAFSFQENKKLLSVAKKIVSSIAHHYLILNDELALTPSHPIYVRGKGYIKAGFVQQGDELWHIQGEWRKVEKIVQKKETVRVFDLEVANTHNFFASGYLVHNKQF